MTGLKVWKDNRSETFPIVPSSLNSSHMVVGHAAINTSTPQAVLWKNGRIEVLGEFGSIAHDVNDAGVIVGNNAAHAAVWRSLSPPHKPIGTLPRRTRSEAFAINNSDVIVGASGGSGGDYSMSFPGKHLVGRRPAGS